jgi:hypothetical protein
MKIDHTAIIQFSTLFIVPFLLMCCHNWLVSHIDKIDQHLAPAHSKKMAVSLAVFIGTVLLMLFLAPFQHIFFNGYGLFVLVFSLATSFLIIRIFLSALLKEIKCQSLFLKLFINQNFWLCIFFMIATELLVLYWLKDIDIYIQDQFIFFVIGYAVLISIGGIFLGRTNRHKEWRLTVVTIIDPIIVVFFAGIFLQMILYMFYNIL